MVKSARSLNFSTQNLEDVHTGPGQRPSRSMRWTGVDRVQDPNRFSCENQLVSRRSSITALGFLRPMDKKNRHETVQNHTRDSEFSWAPVLSPALWQASKPQPSPPSWTHPPVLPPTRSKITKARAPHSQKKRNCTASPKCTTICMAQHLRRLVEAAHTVRAVAVVVQRPK